MGSQAVTVSLYFLSPKMNVLFNPSYVKVSAGGKGPMCLTPLTARVSRGNSEALALHRPLRPSPSCDRLQVPMAGKAPAIVCVWHTRVVVALTPPPASIISASGRVPP